MNRVGIGPFARYGALNPSHELPPFVVQLKRPRVIARISKSGIKGHPDVTMRLETPVIYFYPSRRFDKNTRVNVNIQFKGGVMNEYYPDARARVQGLGTNPFGGEVLSAQTRSFLSWTGLTIGSNKPLPETDKPVWLAPRKVKAAAVRTPAGQVEKYLFYRGVAKLPTLFNVSYDKRKTQITISPRKRNPVGEKLVIPVAWFVDVKKDGRVNFTRIGRLDLSALKIARFSLSRDDRQYTSNKRDQFRKRVKRALVKDGLFADEAEAMLNTWDQEYFRQAGKRILYIMPKAWTEYYLPLHISVPHKRVRTIVGRVDLLEY
jgi:hypothetical protein